MRCNDYDYTDPERVACIYNNLTFPGGSRTYTIEAKTYEGGGSGIGEFCHIIVGTTATYDSHYRADLLGYTGMGNRIRTGEYSVTKDLSSYRSIWVEYAGTDRFLLTIYYTDTASPTWKNI